MKRSEKSDMGEKVAKIKALAIGGITAGERAAAQAALDRVRARASKSPVDWKVTRLVDERTGDSCLGFDFPTRLHGRAFEVIDDDLAEQPSKVRARLKKRGAAFKGSKKDQIAFVEKLLNRMSPEPLILAMKPGFRDDGFILGNVMLGSARGKYRWNSSAQHLGAEDIGDRHGNRDAWGRDVGKTARKSSYLSCGLLIQLAGCIPSYIEWRMKGTTGLTPILSETATFNIEGESGSGKTNIARAAAGLIGPPHLIAKWDFSRRGLEELAESRHDLALILDDVETHVDDGMTLKTALRHVTQVVPKRHSKHIAKKAAKADLPALSWSNFGLTTSPPNLEEMARAIGWTRTDGERVRLISIPVPPVSKGGIFDRLKGSDAERVEEGKVLTKRLERGIAQNFGLIFPLWIEYLLAADQSKQLIELVEKFVMRMAGHGDGWDARYARKLGVLYAVGRLAVKAGILLWPKTWPFKAVARCYRRAIGAIRSDHVLADKTIRLLATLSTDPKRFVRVKPGGQAVIRFGDRTLGLRTKYRGKGVLAVRDETLRGLAGSRAVAKTIITQFQMRQLLLGGHGQRRTTQLPVRILVAKKKIKKPRFLLIDLQRLLKHVKANPQKK
jgi:Domain of unknown function (DUF927)